MESHPKTGSKVFIDSVSADSVRFVVNQLAELVVDYLSQKNNPGAVSKSAIAPEKNSEPGKQKQEATAPSRNDLASKIDHTLLKPDATPEEIQRLCEEARQHHFATVCVNSAYIGLAARLLQGSSTLPIAVVGFPLGAASSEAKAFEAREAIRQGAREIDMVIHVGALKSREYSHVFNDIHQVVEASRPYPVKVILETASLNDEQKIIACALSKAAGAAFVKTSTGFGSGGATAEDIALMRKIVGPEMGVKASGGIRTHEDATKMIAAGANRIGASASVSIVKQESKSSSAQGY